MNKRFVYFLVGALLTGIVLIAWQASATTPNPGHPLTCTVVTCTGVAGANLVACTATCTDGTATGGGFTNFYPNSMTGARSYPNTANGWDCWASPETIIFNCYAVCCKAG